MARPDLRFDGGDLRAAASDSSGLLTALPGDLVERATVAIQHGLLARILLVSPANDIGVARVQFHQPRRAAATLAGDQRGTRSTE